MSESIITFDKVNKWYGNNFHVLRDIDLDVAKGERIVICGPSGSGKSTLIRCINRLEEHQQGRLVVDGLELADDVKAIDAIRKQVGMVFQQFNLFPHLTVLENLTLSPMWVGKIPKKEAEEKAMQQLERVKIAEQALKYPLQLSGGQQQRVAVARSLVLQPSVLLFDEPLSNLDARLRRSMREEIRALQQRLKLTVAYVTHDQAEALAVSDQIVIMNAGLIAQAGTPQQLYEEPDSEFVAGFMGEAMLFAGQALDDGTVRLGPFSVRARRPVRSGAVKVAVRPEAWQVVAPGEGALEGRLSKLAYLGNVQELTVDTALGEIFVVSPDVQRAWRMGETLGLRLVERGLSVVAA